MSKHWLTDARICSFVMIDDSFISKVGVIPAKNLISGTHCAKLSKLSILVCFHSMVCVISVTFDRLKKNSVLKTNVTQVSCCTGCQIGRSNPQPMKKGQVKKFAFSNVFLVSS